MRNDGRIGAIKYVLATYSEFSLVALLTLFFTNMASQQTLAESSVAFIVISYSTFLALGFHNGAVRDGAISTSEAVKNDILRLELYFSGFIAFILFVIALASSSNFYLMAGLLIGAINHLKTSCQTVFRLQKLDALLNTLNLAWASLFFVLFLLVTWLLKDVALQARFFGAWVVAAAFVVGAFYIFCLIILKATRKHISLNWKLFFEILSSSKYMFLMASGLVVLLTSDRVVLNFLDASENVRANFQYVDVLSNIYFLGMTSILYYFTPGLLKRFSGIDAAHERAFREIIAKYAIYLFAVLIGFIFVVVVFLFVIHKFSLELLSVLVSMLILKTFLILLGFVCNFYLAQRLEKVLAVAYLGLMVFGISFSFMYAHFFINSHLLVFLPLVNALLVGALVGCLLKRISVKVENEKNTHIN